jgi:hypothetical protein
MNKGGEPNYIIWVLELFAVCFYFYFFFAFHFIVVSSTPRHVKESKSKYKHRVVKHDKANLYLQLFVGGIMSYLRSVRLYLQLFVGGIMSYLRSVRLYLQLFVGGIMSYLCYLCLFTYSGV